MDETTSLVSNAFQVFMKDAPAAGHGVTQVLPAAMAAYDA